MISMQYIYNVAVFLKRLAIVLCYHEAQYFKNYVRIKTCKRYVKYIYTCSNTKWFDLIWEAIHFKDTVPKSRKSTKTQPSITSHLLHSITVDWI